MKTSFSHDDFIHLALAWGSAISDGNYKVANKNYKLLQKAIKVLGNDGEQAEKTLNLLQENPAMPVRYWTAIWALEIEINTEIAENILGKIANDLSTGPVGAMAKISLLEWRKKKNQI